MKKLQLSNSMNIALVYRPDTPAALSLAITLAQWLKEKKYKVFTAPEQIKIEGTELIKTEKMLRKMSLVIVLGGDGTYLRAVRLLDTQQVPILGINLGSLGFLTPTRAEELFTVVELTLKNKMALQPRSMIKVKHFKSGKIKKEFLALNDVVIERGSLSQLINMQIQLDKMLVSELKADGLIISTPTGSTAYNLAAGGPILHPGARVFVVTPVAPHALTSRPLILPDQKALSFKLVGKLQKAHFVVDGVKILDIGMDDEILIERHDVDHLMVHDPEYNYFHLLRQKLKFGDRS